MLKQITRVLLLTVLILQSVSVSADNKQANTSTIITDTFVVCGNCYTCKIRIHDALDRAFGVSNVDWNFDETLRISYDREIISPKEFLYLISNVGHDNEVYQATDSAYNTLVGTCCEYDRWLTYETIEGTWEVKGTDECKSHIDSVIMDQHGIIDASWENDQINSVVYKQIATPDDFLFKMAVAGFDNEMYRATDEAYQMLAEECQYERAAVDTIGGGDTTTFIRENSVKQIEVYPNPVMAHLYFGENLNRGDKVMIYSAKGILVHEEILIDPNKLNLTHLPRDVYMISIHSKEVIYNAKIIKK